MDTYTEAAAEDAFVNALSVILSHRDQHRNGIPHEHHDTDAYHYAYEHSRPDRDAPDDSVVNLHTGTDRHQLNP